MSLELRSTSKALCLPISLGRRAMGPPPATKPTPTSHCDRHVFSRLAKLMSLACRAPPDQSDRHDGHARYADEYVRPRLQSCRPLKHAGQILHIGVEITVVQEKT